MDLGTGGYGVEPRLEAGQKLEDVVYGRFAAGHVLQDVGDVSAAVHHPALVQGLALAGGARHHLQLGLLLWIRRVDGQLLQDVGPGQGCSVGCGTREGMLLRGIFVKIGQSEHLIKINVQQGSNLLNKLQVIDGIHSYMVSSIISYSASFNIHLNVHTVSLRSWIMNVLVDLDGCKIRILHIKWRPLSLVTFQSRNFPSIKFLGFEISIIENFMFILSCVEFFTGSFNVKL